MTIQITGIDFYSGLVFGTGLGIGIVIGAVVAWGVTTSLVDYYQGKTS